MPSAVGQWRRPRAHERGSGGLPSLPRTRTGLDRRRRGADAGPDRRQRPARQGRCRSRWPAAAARCTAIGEAALVATLHPGELLRRGADKALAWADLCRARPPAPLGATPMRDAVDSYQAAFHRRWGHLRRARVRALAWLLDSPDLLDANVRRTGRAASPRPDRSRRKSSAGWPISTTIRRRSTPRSARASTRASGCTPKS
jgi:hypothetical protein